VIDDLFLLSRQMVRIHHRTYRRYFIQNTDLSVPCAIILGARGVGKTTTLVQVLVDRFPEYTSSRECLYLPIDHAAVGSRTLYEIAKEFAEQGGKLLCIDEIHKDPDWSRDLKSIRDSFPGLQLVISGSSMLHIRRGSHDLARRALVYHIEGLSFREFLEMRFNLTLSAISLPDILSNHESISAGIVSCLEEKEAAVLALFRQYLETGYYPYFLAFDDPVQMRMMVEQSARTALEGDLPAVQPEISGSTIARVAKLLAILAETTPMTPNLARLARLVDVTDSRTMKNYLAYLEDAGLIMGLTRGGGGLRNFEKPEKIYLGDPNLVHALSQWRGADMGSLRETFFCRMLIGRHKICAATKADFTVDDRLSFEIGGRNKGASQIADARNGYLALDEMPVGIAHRIPLWLFGFCY